MRNDKEMRNERVKRAEQSKGAEQALTSMQGRVRCGVDWGGSVGEVCDPCFALTPSLLSVSGADGAGV